jgi:hypothetical protein
MATWSSSRGHLAEAREGHTATLLPNGQVLVAGGSTQNNTKLDSTELYDPMTGTWAAAVALHVARSGQTATLGPRGIALAVGGLGLQGELAAVEYYTFPTRNAPPSGWRSAATLHTARSGHSATLLPDGRVLVVGGVRQETRKQGSYRKSLDSCELYDLQGLSEFIATGRAPHLHFLWSVTGSLSTARNGHSATLLPNGQVLVAGGRELFLGGDRELASAELYDPMTGIWTPIAPLSTPRAGHTATLLSDGKVLVAGGFSQNNTYIACAELYNPTMGTWSLAGSMNNGRNGHTATLLLDGRVLVAGGQIDAQGWEDPVELYDPGSNTWSLTDPLPQRRYGHTATLLPDGRVLVTGGTLYRYGAVTGEAWLYTP